MVRFFKRWQPKAAIDPVRKKRERYRDSPKDRGYGWDWDRLAARYRRNNPICEECERRGRIELMVHVDHMIPVADAPELRLDEDNLQSLCLDCHMVWKRRMESYARASNKVRQLRDWCLHPEKRPVHFR